MEMDKRVDLNIAASIGSKDIDFENEIDDFIFGGFVDWIRRDDTGCYAFIKDDWIPVVDWKDRYQFTGARSLSAFARYFYNLGMAAARGEGSLNL